MAPTTAEVLPRLRAGALARGTAAQLRLLAVAVAVLVVALVTVLTVEVRQEQRGLQLIGRQTAPEVVATSDLYFALNDMDAQLANVLLVGDETTLGFTRAQALDLYQQRRQQVSRDLQQAAAAAADPVTAQSVRDILDALGRYEALAAQTILLDQQTAHAAGQPPAAALDRYRQATDLLATVLLPAARGLTDHHADTLEQTYEDERGRVLTVRAWLIALAVLLVAALAVLQIHLARRFRRMLNIPLAIATVVAVTLGGAAVALTTSVAEHLRGAKKDAFDSILVLNRARAVSYDANADESRYLVDPDRAAQYEQAFLAKTQQLVTLDGATLTTFDARLDDALQAYRRDQRAVGWQGHLGAEFRNITFDGERPAAETALTRFQTYQLDDRRIRRLVQDGKRQQAIAFCTSYAPGDSNYAFDQYDKALVAVIDINQHAFDGSIQAGERELSRWPFVPAAAGAVILTLLLLGLRRRLAEYR
ncbi:hypothetical protein KZZ52_33215 [Dactylosporangium sp. AC04546]|uniref:hypothetical protein n=1 Tax=Dactylosporangium sp. AC04546 TaxID=2862460 RepID=UPI001EE0C5AB|nr:hypothetical protein [Dactylosporangium sp. AC04546]WVK78843.1 hypothetical protein KZZ52_33215 [Dactylosporangium sp. AC04546]